MLLLNTNIFFCRVGKRILNLIAEIMVMERSKEIIVTDSNNYKKFALREMVYLMLTVLQNNSEMLGMAKST